MNSPSYSLEQAAMILTIVLVGMVGAYMISHSSNYVGMPEGFVGAGAVKTGPKTIAFSEPEMTVSRPITESTETRILIGNTPVTQTTTTTSIDYKNGSTTTRLVHSTEMKWNLDELMIAQEQIMKNMVPEEDDSVSTEGLEEDATIAYFQTPHPICRIPQNGGTYTGNVKFCSGTYILPNGINVVGPANVSGTNTILTSGTVYQGTGISGIGPNIEIHDLTVSNYFVGIVISPSYYFDPVLNGNVAVQGSPYIHDTTLSANWSGLFVFQDTATVTNNTITSGGQGIRIFPYFDVSGKHPVPNATVTGNTITLTGSANGYPSYALLLENSDNSLVNYNTISITGSCQGNPCEGLRIMGSQGWQALFNTVIMTNTGLGNSGIYTDGGGTVQDNVFTSDYAGFAIRHLTRIGGVPTVCHSYGGLYTSNVFNKFNGGIWQEWDAQYYANQGYCTVGVANTIYVQGNNFMNPSFTFGMNNIFNPNPPISSQYAFNYFSNYTGCNPQPNGMCGNPNFDWDPASGYFWSGHNYSTNTVANPWP